VLLSLAAFSCMWLTRVSSRFLTNHREPEGSRHPRRQAVAGGAGREVSGVESAEAAGHPPVIALPSWVGLHGLERVQSMALLVNGQAELQSRPGRSSGSRDGVPLAGKQYKGSGVSLGELTGAPSNHGAGSGASAAHQSGPEVWPGPGRSVAAFGRPLREPVAKGHDPGGGAGSSQPCGRPFLSWRRVIAVNNRPGGVVPSWRREEDLTELDGLAASAAAAVRRKWRW